MDDFEHELIRMLRQPQDPRPFEPRHRERLWAVVRARRRARLRLIAAGSAVAAVVCAVGLVLLPRAVDAGPGPGPVAPPGTSVPAPLVSTTLPSTPPPDSRSSSSSASTTTTNGTSVKNTDSVSGTYTASMGANP